MVRKPARKAVRRAAATKEAPRKTGRSAPARRLSKPSARKGRPRVPEGLGYIDGKVLDLAKATIPLNDRGYLLGDGVFETLRTCNGKVFQLDAHADRLRGSLKAIGLDEPVEKEFRSAVQALAREGHKTLGDELYLRVNISTGPMGDIVGTDRGITVTGLCRKFKPYPMQYYSHGIHVITSRQRKDSRNPLSTVKSLSFLPHVAARREAHAVTAHDALLLNEHGRVAEATTSNVFACVGDTVHAPGPAEGAVAGVTRAVVLDLVRDAGLEVVESLTVEDLHNARQAWLTNTTGGIVPVTRFDDQVLGNGTKHNLTAKLGKAFETLLRGGA
ncbi:MAG: aminotransferase class IV [Candidatus Thermoplasmatota archaeon]|jgi:branched-chain amino acid aminotransferase